MNDPPESDRIWPWVRYFLQCYLPVHRGARANTVASYRVTFRQFRRYLYARIGERSARDLPLEALEPKLVLDFLGWLQTAEGGGVKASTRNVRLAALRSFFRCLELYRPEDDRARWERLRHLPQKRTARPSNDHLEVRELNRVFAQIKISYREGLRDLALLTVLYNTGARTSEVAGLRWQDLIWDEPASVQLQGKGSRPRRCPLWESTVIVLKKLFEKLTPAADSRIFINQRGGALTRHGIGRRITHYINLARATTPSLSGKRLSTHSIRHTTAIHLRESGADMHVIKAWLGHRSTRSTDHYLDLDLRAQRELLTRFSPPSVLQQLVPKTTDDWLDNL